HAMGMHEHAMGMGMGGQSIVASHLIVGGLLHVAMSIGAGIAFSIALALLIRAGVQLLVHPLIYVLGGAAGGALLYLIMMEGIAPSMNRTIVDFTPRAPFLLAHLAYGATVATWVYWRTAAGEKHVVIHSGTRYAPA